MSLRQDAKILGIALSHLSMMMNSKRPWKPEIKERYDQLVKTSNRAGEKIMAPGKGLEPLKYLRIFAYLTAISLSPKQVPNSPTGH